MSDLHVVALLPAKPGSEAVLGDALKTLAEASRQEEGCLSYEVYDSVSAPGTFITVELWTGQEALDAHFQTPHLQAALGVAGEHLEGAPQIHPLSAL